MIKSLTIAQLAEHCRTEAEHYKQTGQSNEVYCLELFRRALTDQDEAAWEAILVQYQTLVATWVRNYSRFHQTGENADFFINGAFARLWQFGSKSKIVTELDSLGKCLHYLKLCIGSAIEDYLRKEDKDALKRKIPLENYDHSIPTVESDTEHLISLSELREVLWETVQDDVERLVAEESWVYGFAPRQIQTRHSKTFATVADVRQIKRNILKRLRRRFKREIAD